MAKTKLIERLLLNSMSLMVHHLDQHIKVLYIWNMPLAMFTNILKSVYIERCSCFNN